MSARYSEDYDYDDDYLDELYADRFKRQHAAKVRHAEYGSPDYYELTDEEDEE